MTPPADRLVGFDGGQPKAINRIVTSRIARNCTKSGTPVLRWLRFVTLQMIQNDRKSGFLQTVVTNRKPKKVQNDTKTRTLTECGYDSKHIFSGFLGAYTEFFPKNVVTIQRHIVSIQAPLLQVRDKTGKPPLKGYDSQLRILHIFKTKHGIHRFKISDSKNRFCPEMAERAVHKLRGLR